MNSKEALEEINKACNGFVSYSSPMQVRQLVRFIQLKYIETLDDEDKKTIIVADYFCRMCGGQFSVIEHVKECTPSEALKMIPKKALHIDCKEVNKKQGQYVYGIGELARLELK